METPVQTPIQTQGVWGAQASPLSAITFDFRAPRYNSMWTQDLEQILKAMKTWIPCEWQPVKDTLVTGKGHAAECQEKLLGNKDIPKLSDMTSKLKLVVEQIAVVNEAGEGIGKMVAREVRRRAREGRGPPTFPSRSPAAVTPGFAWSHRVDPSCQVRVEMSKCFAPESAATDAHLARGDHTSLPPGIGRERWVVRAPRALADALPRWTRRS